LGVFGAPILYSFYSGILVRIAHSGISEIYIGGNNYHFFLYSELPLFGSLYFNHLTFWGNSLLLNSLILNS